MNLTHWMISSLRGQVPSPWLEVGLALAAVVCGGIIGTERERHDKPAGMRTLILVCLGSAVFTMVSFAFTTTTGDSGRVAAQIVTGIGFLGAGAILHSRASVSGMTTAAAIWITAAIGITVGVGLPVAGLGASLLVRTVLAGVYQWEIRHLGGMKPAIIQILFDPDHGKSRIRIDCIREEFRIGGHVSVEVDPANGWVRETMELCLPRRHLREFLNALVELPAVREIRELGKDSASPPKANPARKET